MAWRLEMYSLSVAKLFPRAAGVSAMASTQADEEEDDDDDDDDDRISFYVWRIKQSRTGTVHQDEQYQHEQRHRQRLR
jgi:hypothetical protein